MSPAAAIDRPPVQKGQILTYERLREETVAALDAQPRGTQARLADELGVTPAAISNARKYSGTRYASLQIRIIERLNERYKLEEIGGFRVDYAG